MASREPLMLTQIVVALLTLLLHLLNIKDLDTDAVEGAATFLLVILGGLWARRKVTPVADPRNNAGDSLHSANSVGTFQ